MKTCDYGCNQEAKYYFKTVKKWCCSKFSTQCVALREKNRNGLIQAYSNGKRKAILINQPHENNIRKCTLTLIKNLQEKYSKLSFEEKPYGERVRILNKEQKNKCAICGIKNVWNDKTLKFQYDHIDGNRENNKRVNSRLICPNCHSQTKTYCRGNKTIISENELKRELLKNNLNINKSLKSLGVVT